MQTYAHPQALVDTQWLADRLDDPNLRIIEFDLDPQPYQNAHIPGAIFWHVITDFLNPNLSINLDRSSISKLLSRSGITPETTIVGYGSYPDTGALIFWFFKLIGHERVYVLNGGYQKWMAEDRPISSALSSYPSTEYLVTSIDNSLRVFQPEVSAALNRSNLILLDVRTPAEYRGEIFMMKPPTTDERGGHIPGAINIEHLQALNPDGTFKSPQELLAFYRERGVSEDKEIFTYCAIGGRSACVWFVLKYLLGYPQVRNYDGSWNEWSRLPDVEVVSGFDARS